MQLRKNKKLQLRERKYWRNRKRKDLEQFMDKHLFIRFHVGNEIWKDDCPWKTLPAFLEIKQFRFSTELCCFVLYHRLFGKKNKTGWRWKETVKWPPGSFGSNYLTAKSPPFFKTNLRHVCPDLSCGCLYVWIVFLKNLDF